MFLRGLLAVYTGSPANVCGSLECRTRLILAVRVSRPKLFAVGPWERLEVDCVTGDNLFSHRQSYFVRHKS